MKQYLMLARLQLKAAFCSVPKIIGQTVLITLLVVLIGTAAGSLLHPKDDPVHMTIGLVFPQKRDANVEKAFDYLSEVESIKAVCEFIPYEKEAAYQALRNGKVTAVVIIPDDFIQGIMTGNNIPAKIVFPERGTDAFAEILRQMVQAGASDLSTAEAGIYAVDDVCRTLTDSSKAVQESEDYLNQQYFEYALDRKVYFGLNEVSALGSLNLIQFYTATGIVLLLMLGGILCAPVFRQEKNVFYAVVKRQGIRSGAFDLFQILSVTVVAYVFLIVPLLLTAISTIRYPFMKNVISWSGPVAFLRVIPSLFLLLFAIFSLIHAVYRWCSHQIAAVVLLFLLTFIMMYASGCFIPSALLPAVVREIGEYLPTAGYSHLCGQLLTGEIAGKSILMNAGYAVLFLVLSCVKRREA